MASYKITMKDGTIKEFKDEQRPGGSYSTTGVSKDGFFVVNDVWGKSTWIPISDIKEINEDKHIRGGGW